MFYWTQRRREWEYLKVLKSNAKAFAEFTERLRLSLCPLQVTSATLCALCRCLLPPFVPFAGDFCHPLCPLTIADMILLNSAALRSTFPFKLYYFECKITTIISNYIISNYWCPIKNWAEPTEKGTNLSASPQRFVILRLRQTKFKSMGKGTNFGV